MAYAKKILVGMDVQADTSTGAILVNVGTVAASAGVPQAATASVTVDHTAGGTVILAADPLLAKVKVQNNGAVVVWYTVDGTAPVVGTGLALYPYGDEREFGPEARLGIKGIAASATAAVNTQVFH